MICFENFLGNPMLAQRLKKTLESGKASHSYIISGNIGTGRGYIARAFAKALLCEKESSGNCDCKSCTTFESFNNPDVIYVRLPKDRKTIGVDQIRQEVIKQASVKPFLYRFKIFIIYDADKMTAEAQNAFLKTLEEPEPDCKFILISQNYNSFLPTILSRCVLFKLNPIAPDDIKKYLKEMGLDSYDADIISRYSGGSLKRARDMANDGTFFDTENKAAKLMIDIENIEKGSVSQIYSQFEVLESLKDNIADILEMSQSIYKDIIMYKVFGDENVILHKNSMNDIKYIAERISLKKAVDRFEILFSTDIRLKQNANYSMTMEVMLFDMKKK